MHSKSIAASPEPESQATKPWLWFIAVSWVTAMVCMLWVLWSLDRKTGAEAATPPEPAYTVQVAAADRPTFDLASLLAHGEPDLHAANVPGRPLFASAD